MKKHLLFLFAALLPLLGSAHDFQFDGIYYNITSEADKTAEVTFKGDSYDSYSGEYSGSITIPATVTYDGVAYSVTSIGNWAFEDCESLTAINILEGVTSIGNWAFFSCSSLTAITIPESVTSIGVRAFAYCESLTAINIPEGVKSIGEGAFYSTAWYNNLPDGLVYIGKVLYEYKGTMPENTSIEVKEGIVSVSPSAFSDCSSLTTITLPESVTSIGDWAFSDCSSLTAITIPENSQLTSIGECAFWGCSSLTAITLPEGVTSIGLYAFYDCSSLTEVYCYAEHVPEAESSSFSNTENATLYVPASAIGDYLNTAPWSSFSRIKALRGMVGAVANGEYYLYHADSHRFLSRGEYWGTCATVDKYGVPFVWTADEYSLQFLDSNVRLFETDGSSIYTDNATTGFNFEAVEGGYLLKSLKSDRYLTIVDHQIVSVADDASAAVVWQLKSKAEHDAIVAGYVEENYRNVIAAAGITATAGDFADYLATLEAEDKTSAIGTARFNGNAGEWIFTEGRHQDNQPAIGTDFCELWQATGRADASEIPLLI